MLKSVAKQCYGLAQVQRGVVPQVESATPRRELGAAPCRVQGNHLVGGRKEGLGVIYSLDKRGHLTQGAVLVVAAGGAPDGEAAQLA